MHSFWIGYKTILYSMLISHFFILGKNCSMWPLYIGITHLYFPPGSNCKVCFLRQVKLFLSMCVITESVNLMWLWQSLQLLCIAQNPHGLGITWGFERAFSSHLCSPSPLCEAFVKTLFSNMRHNSCKYLSPPYILFHNWGAESPSPKKQWNASLEQMQYFKYTDIFPPNWWEAFYSLPKYLVECHILCIQNI